MSDGEYSDDASVYVSVWNNVPEPSDDFGYTLHDQDATGNVAWNDGLMQNGSGWHDYEGDAVTFSLVDSTSSGTVSLDSSTGEYVYTPNAAFVGNDSFTYRLSDGIGTSTYTATVSIYVTNSPPYAQDDYAYVDIPEQPVPVPIYVLDNDASWISGGIYYDSDGDEITITSVSSPSNGGTAWIDSSGLFIWYLPPTIAGSSVSIGGVLPFAPTTEENYVDGELPSGAWEAFTDTFTYTVADTIGASDEGFVQVNAPSTPEWTWELLPGFDEADEIGLDGQPGYDLKILQTYGKNARGQTAPAGVQMWQKNTQNGTMFFLPATGNAVMQNDPGSVFLDVSNLAGKKTPIKFDDRLQAAEAPGTVLVIFQWVDKELGFNYALPDGKRKQLKTTSRTGTRKPADAQTRAELDKIEGPKLEVSTLYTFVDREAINAALQADRINQADYNTIKNYLSGVGIDLESLPDQLERLQIGDHNWEYLSP